ADGVSGALIRKGKDSVIIGVNSAHHSNRQRFTIAHEIGHYALHKGCKLHVDQDFRINWRADNSSTRNSHEEVEANRFAAELLMPVFLIARDLLRFDDVDDDTVRWLSRRYKVSSQAMQIRLTNLGYIAPY